VVYHAEEELNVALHSRLVAGPQGNHPERWGRTDHRRVCGGLRRKFDLLGRRSVLGVRSVRASRRE
jgi:hypothetical protein